MDLRSSHVTNADPRPAERKLNSEAPWDSFDSAAYVDHNYGRLRSDDARILEVVRRHFSDHFRGRSGRAAEKTVGIDVGAGANLYPALAMLPWCDEITLFERSAANVGYLNGQRDSYDPHWDQFWDALCAEPAYRERVAEPRATFSKIVQVEAGNLFDLRHNEGVWSVGTMFFVAESLSTSYEEFETAVERFMRALAPGAPFATAFMEGSLGYQVGEHSFPACAVTETEVRKSLRPFAAGEVEITLIGKPGGALRPGYEGMIVACGRRSSE